MKLDEETASARRIGPIKAIEIDGTPVTDFSAPGSKQISINNGAWTNTASAIGVIGDGYVYLEASPVEVSVQGFISVRLADVCLERVIREELELAPQGIPVGTNDAALLHVGPLEAKDEAGDAVVGELFDGAGELEVSVNGSAWAPAAGDIVEMSDGFYDYVPDPTEVSAVGWLAVKITGPCQEFVFRVDIVTENGAGSPVEPTAPGTPVPVTHDDIPVINHVALALDRLPQQYRGTDDIPTELLTA